MRRYTQYALSAVKAHNRRNSLIRHPASVIPLALRGTQNYLAFLRRSHRLASILGQERGVVSKLLRDAERVSDQIAGAISHKGHSEPWYLSPHWGPVLYLATRLLRPSVVLETGIAGGCSSAFFLQALVDNGKGELYSIGLPEGVPAGFEIGWLVPEVLRSRWHVILGDSKEELPLVLEQTGPVDIFFHDSRHTYEHMMWEFQTSWPSISYGGMLISDDTNMNNAWRDFCVKMGVHSDVFHHFGFLPKPRDKRSR